MRAPPHFPIKSYINHKRTRPGETGETTQTDREAVGNLHDENLNSIVTVEEAYLSHELTRIIERLDVKYYNKRSLITINLINCTIYLPKGRGFKKNENNVS